MQSFIDGYRGLLLLVTLNRDWLVMLATTVAALLAAGLFGVQLLPN